MSPITTHILDTAKGRPATAVRVTLEAADNAAGWSSIGSGQTDEDGRCKTLMNTGDLSAGIYRITFDTGGYYADLGEDTFYPEVRIAFEVKDASQHYHVPLLLNPFGYSTYRGS